MQRVVEQRVVGYRGESRGLPCLPVHMWLICRRYVDLVFVQFTVEDAVGCTKDRCSAGWTKHKGGLSSPGRPLR